MYTCIRIEVFNIRAGGYLPREDDADWGISEWREMAQSARRRDMEDQFRKEAQSQGRAFANTPEQEAQIIKAIEHDKENSAFRDFVGSFGLMQYIVAPIAFYIAILLVTSKSVPKSKRFVAGGMCLLSGACIVLMFYRGYFSSLG